MGKRRLAREYCLQALYLTDTAGLSPDEALKVLDHHGVPLEPKSADFARNIISCTFSNLEKLDAAIQSYTHNWRIDRMASVDRCILRMAACEITATPETPIGVIIDEAIELAKKYSTENSSRFINGVLDRLKEERKGNNANGEANKKPCK